VFIWRTVKDGMSFFETFGRVANIMGFVGENPEGGDTNGEVLGRILRVVLAWSALVIIVLARYCGYDGVRWVAEWLTGLRVWLL
jgi:hypothetical protein